MDESRKYYELVAHVAAAALGLHLRHYGPEEPDLPRDLVRLLQETGNFAGLHAAMIRYAEELERRWSFDEIADELRELVARADQTDEAACIVTPDAEQALGLARESSQEFPAMRADLAEQLAERGLVRLVDYQLHHGPGFRGAWLVEVLDRLDNPRAGA